MSISGSDPPPKWQPVKHPTMDELAQEIGRLCLYWGELERTTTLFLAALIPIRDENILNIVVGALDFRAKLQMLLPLAFSKKTSDRWYEEVEAIVSLINNELRTERNRVIHDFWVDFPDATTPMRMQMTGRVVKIQSRTRHLELMKSKHFKPEDIGALYARIIDADTQLTKLGAAWMRKLTARLASRGRQRPPAPPPNRGRDRTIASKKRRP